MAMRPVFPEEVRAELERAVAYGQKLGDADEENTAAEILFGLQRRVFRAAVRGEGMAKVFCAKGGQELTPNTDMKDLLPCQAATVTMLREAGIEPFWDWDDGWQLLVPVPIPEPGANPSA